MNYEIIIIVFTVVLVILLAWNIVLNFRINWLELNLKITRQNIWEEIRQMQQPVVHERTDHAKD